MISSAEAVKIGVSHIAPITSELEEPAWGHSTHESGEALLGKHELNVVVELL